MPILIFARCFRNSNHSNEGAGEYELLLEQPVHTIIIIVGCCGEVLDGYVRVHIGAGSHGRHLIIYSGGANQLRIQGPIKNTHVRLRVRSEVDNDTHYFSSYRGRLGSYRRGGRWYR